MIIVIKRIMVIIIMELLQCAENVQKVVSTLVSVIRAQRTGVWMVFRSWTLIKWHAKLTNVLHAALK